MESWQSAAYSGHNSAPQLLSDTRSLKEFTSASTLSELENVTGAVISSSRSSQLVDVTRVKALEQDVDQLKSDLAESRSQTDWHKLQFRQLQVEFEDLQAFCRQLEKENTELKSQGFRFTSHIPSWFKSEKLTQLNRSRRRTSWSDDHRQSKAVASVDKRSTRTEGTFEDDEVTLASTYMSKMDDASSVSKSHGGQTDLQHESGPTPENITVEHMHMIKERGTSPSAPMTFENDDDNSLDEPPEELERTADITADIQELVVPNEFVKRKSEVEAETSADGNNEMASMLTTDTTPAVDLKEKNSFRSNRCSPLRLSTFESSEFSAELRRPSSLNFTELDVNDEDNATSTPETNTAETDVNLGPQPDQRSWWSLWTG